MVCKKGKSPKVSANTSGLRNVVNTPNFTHTVYHIPIDFSIGGEENCRI
jgi:hypothetical protein